jgi:hypothetical protein
LQNLGCRVGGRGDRQVRQSGEKAAVRTPLKFFVVINRAKARLRRARVALLPRAFLLSRVLRVFGRSTSRRARVRVPVQVQVLDVVLGLQKLEIERLVEDDLFQFFVFGFGRPLLGQRKRAVRGFPVFRLGRARRVYAARSVSKQQLVLGGHQPHPAQRVLVVREDGLARGFPSRSTRRRKMRPSRRSESGFHSSEKQFVLLRFGWISSGREGNTSADKG